MVKTRGQKAQEAQEAQQSALQQSAPPALPRPRKSKKVAKTAQPATEEDEGAVDDEERGDHAVSKPKPGRKRPATSANEEPSPKARKVGAVRPRNRNAARSGSPVGDAPSGEQLQHKGKGKDKGKAADANVSDVACCNYDGNTCADGH